MHTSFQSYDFFAFLPMKVSSTEYPQFLASLKATIRQRQYQALRAVNHELLALYLEIGEAIYRKQEELGWGKAVVETVAHDLQTEFPGRNGYSAQNLWLMRQFYREYLDLPKLQPLVREISWAKNLVILARCKDSLQREFYLRATARFGWTKAVLQHQIDNQSYEKYLLNQTNFDQALPESIIRAHLGNLIRCANPFGAAYGTLSRPTARVTARVQIRTTSYGFIANSSFR
jgi:predicted nuclease of restriction endonuclease-like (RecB) superfamily